MKTLFQKMRDNREAKLRREMDRAMWEERCRSTGQYEETSRVFDRLLGALEKRSSRVKVEL